MVSEWQALAAESERLRGLIPRDHDDACYQLVHYAVEATANLYELRLAESQNLLYAKQRRAATNDRAAEARARFEADRAMSDYYNTTLASGKWKGFQTQPKIGYGGPYRNSSWQQPERDNQALPDFIWPELVEIELPPEPTLGVAVSGSEDYYPKQKQLALPEFSPFQTQPSQFIEVFSRGTKAASFEISFGAPRLKVSPPSGTVDKQVRVEVNVDFTQAPLGRTEVPITVSGPKGKSVRIQARVTRPPVDAQSLSGFVESNGTVAIEAERFDRNVSAGGITWTLISDIGRTGSGLVPFPVTARRQDPSAGSAHLEYEVELFSAGTVTVWAYLSPRLPVQGGDGLKYGVSLDDDPPQIVNTTTPLSSLPPTRGWERNTSDNVNLTSTTHTVTRTGHHVLKFWMVDPGVVVQKLVIDTGGLQPSYLGPPESFRAGAPARP